MQGIERPKIVIAGAGIVGLATAYHLHQLMPDVTIIIIEKENDVVQHQTGHNSGVIHSGIYYQPGSKKAQNCLRGYKMLLRFCEENNIPVDICGKLIVASDANELPYLKKLFERGMANGLNLPPLLSAETANEIEPHVRAVKAIFVPQTGIVDYTQVGKTLKNILVQNGIQFHFSEKVEQISQLKNKISVITNQQTVSADYFINCCGLYSDTIALKSGIAIQHRIIPFRGEYWNLKAEARYKVRNLIYPVPHPNLPFLGVHFTRMIHGGVETGPNAVLAFRREGYLPGDFKLNEAIQTLTWPGFYRMAMRFRKQGVEEWLRSFSKAKFVEALQKLIPSINSNDLEPAPAGVRAQALDRNGQLLDDFLLLEAPKMLHVCNAPSPAATASLSIGLSIAEKVKLHFQ